MSKIFWSDLKSESQEHLREIYKEYLDCYETQHYNGKDTIAIKAKIEELEDLFGKNNIYPESRILNWEDVVNPNKGNFGCYDEWLAELEYNMCYFDRDIIKKTIAAIKITKIIDLGYGGKIPLKYIQENPIFCIKSQINYNPNSIMEPKYYFKIFGNANSENDLLLFRTKEDAETFLKNNEELIKDYFICK